MPDFSFPEWMLRQNTFADSLTKGAAVGSAIANARYRNQALAAQAIQSEREYDLREKQLASQNRTADLNHKLQSQLIEDQASDKAAITDWIQQRNQLPMKERLSMDLPNVRLPQSYEIANKIMDNDRMAYQQSEEGQFESAITLRSNQLPFSYRYRFKAEQDPEKKLQILEEGEAVAAARAEALRAIVPTITAESREAVAKIRADSQENVIRLKQQAAIDKTQGVGEAQFVNRHLNTVLSQLANDNDYLDKSVEVRMDAATKLLQKAYRESGIGNLPPAITPSAPTIPVVGEIRNGYKFKGGDPADPASWEKLP